MSRRLSAAALAALTLLRCDRPPPPPTSLPAPRVEAPALAAPAPAAPAAALADAGPLDTLALKHDAPQVDHLARAHLLEQDAELGGALAEARRALYSTPGDEETLALVARLAQRLGRPAVAAEAWGRLGATSPDDATAPVQQGRAFLQLKDFSAALAAGQEALRRDAGNPEGWQVVGLGHLGQKALGPAISAFEKAVALAPHHGWALNNLGYACLLAGEDTRAVEALAQAGALLPTAAAVQNNLGVALERAGRVEEAKEAYQRAMDLSPRYVKARLNAARVARVTLSLPEAEAPRAAPEEAPPAAGLVPDDAQALPEAVQR